jgi:hypothetical protein
MNIRLIFNTKSLEAMKVDASVRNNIKPLAPARRNPASVSGIVNRKRRCGSMSRPMPISRRSTSTIDPNKTAIPKRWIVSMAG